jgi:GDP-4-dehydro-6-deoxy-D-mannose reductase
MKALVTGATGFVGPHLVRHLEASGDDVICPGDASNGFDIGDARSLCDAFTATRPDVVYHLAAFSDVGASWRDPAACYEANVAGTANVLAAALDAGVRRVLVVGSSEEYGRIGTRSPVPETAPLRPLTPYGVSKVAASFLARQAWCRYRLETVMVRTFSHTGPGQSPRFVIPALAHRIAAAERTGTNAIAVGSLEPVRDVSDVRDVVRAYRALVVDGAPGEVYNVAQGTGHSIGELAQLLIAQATRPIELRVDPELVRPVEVPFSIGDPAKLVATTGWTPEYTLAETLAAVLTEARHEPPTTTDP